MYKRDLPQAVLKAHKKYGPVIRIGPNDVNFQGRDAIDPIYKAGRAMPKTKFYDGFTPATIANLFSSRDETVCRNTITKKKVGNAETDVP